MSQGKPGDDRAKGIPHKDLAIPTKDAPTECVECFSEDINVHSYKGEWQCSCMQCGKYWVERFEYPEVYMSDLQLAIHRARYMDPPKDPVEFD